MKSRELYEENGWRLVGEIESLRLTNLAAKRVYDSELYGAILHDDPTAPFWGDEDTPLGITARYLNRFVPLAQMVILKTGETAPKIILELCKQIQAFSSAGSEVAPGEIGLGWTDTKPRVIKDGFSPDRQLHFLRTELSLNAESLLNLGISVEEAFKMIIDDAVKGYMSSEWTRDDSRKSSTDSLSREPLQVLYDKVQVRAIVEDFLTGNIFPITTPSKQPP